MIDVQFDTVLLSPATANAVKVVSTEHVVANGSTLLQLKRFSSVAGISRQNHPINRSAIKEQVS